MKKFIPLLLVLLVVLSACGKETAPQVSGVQAETTEAAVPTAKETEAAVPEETEPAPAETEPAETEAAPAFDTGWAGEDYVMAVPEPPYQYEVLYSESQNMYTIQNADIEEEISYDSMAAYCETLKSIGFTNIEKDILSADDFQAELTQTGGAATLFIAGNDSGYRVTAYKEFSTWWIMVYCP